ncbi:hypothetical protein [Parachlamydia acanthamoebae]|jgi:hypothetical protein|nr:hypothetical protein [Parachlamydia acanthamoebae]KIA77238.1 hypothetical protein DB43_GR00050 [Parachlamydia acanthamoebae]
MMTVHNVNHPLNFPNETSTAQKPQPTSKSHSFLKIMNKNNINSIPSSFKQIQPHTHMIIPPMNIARSIAPEAKGMSSLPSTVYVNGRIVFTAGEKLEQKEAFMHLLKNIYLSGFKNFGIQSISLTNDLDLFLKKMTEQTETGIQFQQNIKKYLCAYSIIHFGKLKELFSNEFPSTIIQWDYLKKCMKEIKKKSQHLRETNPQELERIVTNYFIKLIIYSNSSFQNTLDFQSNLLAKMTNQDQESLQFQEIVSCLAIRQKITLNGDLRKLENLFSKQFPDIAINWKEFENFILKTKENLDEFYQDHATYKKLMFTEFIKYFVPAYEILQFMTINQLQSIKILLESIFPRFNDENSKQKMVIRDFTPIDESHKSAEYWINCDAKGFSNTLVKNKGIYPKQKNGLHGHDTTQKIATLYLKWMVSKPSQNELHTQLTLDSLELTPYGENQFEKVVKNFRKWEMPQNVTNSTSEKTYIKLSFVSL